MLSFTLFINIFHGVYELATYHLHDHYALVPIPLYGSPGEMQQNGFRGLAFASLQFILNTKFRVEQ